MLNWHVKSATLEVKGTLKNVFWNVSSTWKYGLKRKRKLISTFLAYCSLCACFDNIIRKIKPIFFACIHEHISAAIMKSLKKKDLLRNWQSFVRKDRKISLTWFLVVSKNVWLWDFFSGITGASFKIILYNEVKCRASNNYCKK